jgi:hypothetical protein
MLLRALVTLRRDRLRIARGSAEMKSDETKRQGNSSRDVDRYSLPQSEVLPWLECHSRAQEVVLTAGAEVLKVIIGNGAISVTTDSVPSAQRAPVVLMVTDPGSNPAVGAMISCTPAVFSQTPNTRSTVSVKVMSGVRPAQATADNR